MKLGETSNAEHRTSNIEQMIPLSPGRRLPEGGKTALLDSPPEFIFARTIESIRVEYFGRSCGGAGRATRLKAEAKIEDEGEA